MTDSRIEKIAQTIVRYSLNLKAGERVLFELTDAPDELGIALLRESRARGAVPLIELRHSRVTREIIRGTGEDHAHLVRDLELARMHRVDAYCAVRGAFNTNELSDTPQELMSLYQKTMAPVLEYRVEKTRWVVLRWPTPSMAQAAQMSTEAFEEFYFNVCTMNYPKMAEAMIPLANRMKQADRVEIKGPGTDLSFSIKGIGAKMCKGTRNLPDGEVFSCPVKDSVHGTISFNAPSLYEGTRFEHLRLELREGRIVNATSNYTEKLNRILDTDEGARYIGEFSLAFNPLILQPMGDILFDEKIAGSLHFTPGKAYKDCGNGNESAVHWDMVLIQRPEWGGGEIWFDGELIRKDGEFVPDDLQPLNPASLLSSDHCLER
jgi:aminopeptidase